MTVLNVARDFSPYPAGRYRTDGPFSGEAFRDMLKVKLAGEVLWSSQLTVELDGAMGYGSGFLEEAFGGLVRCERLPVAHLRDFIVLKSSDSSLVDEIWSYVEDAGRR
jgi:hypothetical protein